jgi:periplasmic protein CpxP/Spy
MRKPADSESDAGFDVGLPEGVSVMPTLTLLVLAADLLRFVAVAGRAIAQIPSRGDGAAPRRWAWIFAGALLAGISAMESAPAFAQPALSIERDYPATERVQLSQLVERKIAFVKSELKITPAQEARWMPVATAMRDNAEALDRMMMIARQERLPRGEARDDVLREAFQRVQHENETRLAEALKPLYRSLSSAQREVAGALFVGFPARAPAS